MSAGKCGCERCLQVGMPWVTWGHGPAGPQGSYLRAVMASVLNLFLANSVLPLSLCSSLPPCCLQAACVAQRSPAAGAGGAQPTSKAPPGRKPPFPHGVQRVGRYSLSPWILGENLHKLPVMPQAWGKPRGAGMGDTHRDTVPPRDARCWCTPRRGEQSSGELVTHEVRLSVSLSSASPRQPPVLPLPSPSCSPPPPSDAGPNFWDDHGLVRGERTSEAALDKPSSTDGVWIRP